MKQERQNIEIKYTDVGASAAGAIIVNGQNVGFGKDGIIKSLTATKSFARNAVIHINVILSRDLNNRPIPSDSSAYDPLRGTIFESDPEIKKYLDTLSGKYQVFITVEGSQMGI
jgi:hypothetical protein